MRRVFAACALLALLLLGGCAARKAGPEGPVIEDVVISSRALGKDVPVKVYLPEGYTAQGAYPVLYFLADYGGTGHTVMQEYGAAETAAAMLEAGEIAPVIIVGLGTDGSFGINSAEETGSVETASGKGFAEGRYADFILEELIAYIDGAYATLAERDGRFIGGYSMGGFAALHNAFLRPALFSKAGGHSPSLFVGDFPDATVSDWLYPTEAMRRGRDPIWLAREADLTGLSVFLDVEAGGSDGVEALYEVLTARGVDAEFRVLSLSHSRASCAANMREYLLFYVGLPQG